MVFGALGIAVALVLFLSPVPTFRRIVRARSTLAFSQAPFLAQLVESSFWAMWSTTVHGRLEMLINNLVGCACMLVYVVLFACFAHGSERRRRVVLQDGVAVAMVAAGLAVLLLVEDQAVASTVLSACAVTLNTVKYASPLSVARLVVRTKSVEFMPLPLTLACLACSVLWATYGLLVADVWIVVPNVAGLACSAAQVFLWCWYCRGAGEHKESEQKARGAGQEMVIEEGKASGGINISECSKEDNAIVSSPVLCRGESELETKEVLHVL